MNEIQTAHYSLSVCSVRRLHAVKLHDRNVKTELGAFLTSGKELQNREKLEETVIRNNGQD